MAKISEIKTITPGVISKVKGHSPKLIIRISIRTLSGWKLLARSGKTVQEIFVITSLNKNKMEEIIKEIVNN